MSDEETSVPRRPVLKAMAALGMTGGAGCTEILDGGSEENNDDGPAILDNTDEDDIGRPEEDTPSPTEEPEVEHLETGELTGRWLNLPSESSWMNGLLAGSYSPQQIYEEHGVFPEGTMYVMPNYDMIDSLDPREIPETFYQYDDVGSTLKVDQLPAGVSGEDVVSEIDGFGNFGTVSGFDIYSRGADDNPVYAIGDNVIAIADHMFHPSRDSSSEIHRRSLNNFLENYSEDGSNLNPELETLKDAVGPRDTLDVLRSQRDLRGYGPLEGENILREFPKNVQPLYGMTSVDVEEERMYGAWIFEDEETAERVGDNIDEYPSRFDWEHFDYEGRVITAEGSIDVEERVVEEGMYDGFLAPPMI